MLERKNAVKMMMSEEELDRAKQAWISAPPICTQMPIRFPKGGELSEFSAFCKCCNQKISRHLLHGAVNFPLENMAVFDAWGVCLDCRCLTKFFARVREGETALIMEWRLDNGQWVRRAMEYVDPWIKRKTKALLRKILFLRRE